MAKHWCILTMSPGRTIPVARALAEAGFVVWTPIETQRRRVPRSRKIRDVATAVTPSLVFADYARLPELVALSRSPAMVYQVWDEEQRRMVEHGIPYFKVFRHLSSYPRIADRALDPLRLAEQMGRPKAAAPKVRAGDMVRYPGAGLEGLTGVVERMKGRYALVCFPGLAIPFEIEPQHLLSGKRAA